jgi:hypothetical protein
MRPNNHLTERTRTRRAVFSSAGAFAAAVALSIPGLAQLTTKEIS